MTGWKGRMPNPLNQNARFSPWERQVCEMIFRDRLTRKEIAARLETTQPMICVLVNRAMKKAGAKVMWELYPLFCPEEFKKDTGQSKAP